MEYIVTRDHLQRRKGDRIREGEVDRLRIEQMRVAGVIEEAPEEEEPLPRRSRKPR